jgi:hypothetical protein
VTGSAGRVLRRYRWPAAVFAIAVVAVVAAYVVLTDRDSAPESAAGSRACEKPLAARPGVAGPVSAPVGGGLRVVEQGFTKLPGTGASLGAIVENTSDLVAYGTRVDFRVFDKHDRFAIAPTAPPNQRVVIRVILPGQRIGVGSDIPLSVESATRGHRVADIVTFDVKMTTAQWWSLGGTKSRPVRTWYQQLKRDASGAAELLYTVDVPLCRAASRGGVSVILRDRGGAIVGGSATSGGTCVPGRHTEGVFDVKVPAGVDDHQTEIYPYCDLLSIQSPS